MDNQFEEIGSVSREEIFQRSRIVKNPSYDVALGLLKGGEYFVGQVKVKFNIFDPILEDVFLDYKGREVKYLVVNGKELKPGVVNNDAIFRHHRIYLPKELLIVGTQKNEIFISFVSNYVRDCQGIHYYFDKEDNSEYLYSQFESVDAHICFPCFDQPDLKAPYTLLTCAPKLWNVISTCEEIKNAKELKEVHENGFTKSLPDSQQLTTEVIC